MIRTASFGILPLQPPSSCKLFAPFNAEPIFFLSRFLLSIFSFFPPSSQFFIDDSGQTRRVSALYGRWQVNGRPSMETVPAHISLPSYYYWYNDRVCRDFGCRLCAVCIIYKRGGKKKERGRIEQQKQQLTGFASENDPRLCCG